MAIGLWQTLRCRDAATEMAWLVAVGFVEREVHRNEDDPSIIEHALFLWPAGGGIMLGSDRESPGWDLRPGSAGTYLVTDDPEVLYERAVAAGATGVTPPKDEPYGRDATVQDPEGNLWSFGTYAPI